MRGELAVMGAGAGRICSRFLQGGEIGGSGVDALSDFPMAVAMSVAMPFPGRSCRSR
jgi:hypothetical protein